MAAASPGPGPVAVRSPLIVPVLTANKSIRFLHPGYDAPNNVLFRLARVDTVDGDAGLIKTSAPPPTLGVCHATALVACQVVANNAWSGLLALDKEGKSPVPASLDGILVLDEYYFVVHGSPLYPIVPSFRHWPFPHDRIPTFWHALPAGHASGSCILTDSSYSKTEAHLVPREEDEWFKYNSMGQYGLDRKDTEDSANLAVLRADIQTWLDARGWTIVPKADRYVAHVLDPTEAPEFFCWYHNVELRLSGGRLAPEYLFARFAWTAIQLVKPFVMSLSPRAVVHVQTDPDKAVRWVVETMQPAQLENLYGGGGGSRSASPNKRKRKQGSSSDRDSSVHDNAGLSRAAEINMLYQRITEDHNARVRRKRRRDSGENDYRLEEPERRGRPRKRRSWDAERNPATTDHENSASLMSTEASLGHNSFTTSSTTEQQEDLKLGLQKTEPSLDVSCATVDVDG